MFFEESQQQSPQKKHQQKDYSSPEIEPSIAEPLKLKQLRNFLKKPQRPVYDVDDILRQSSQTDSDCNFKLELTDQVKAEIKGTDWLKEVNEVECSVNQTVMITGACGELDATIVASDTRKRKVKFIK